MAVESYHDRREQRRIVVVVDYVEATRTALCWAMNNVVRGGDIITLLHVHPSSASQASVADLKQLHWHGSSFIEGARRLLRLKGFHLALSFKDLCDLNPEVKVEIVVMEGDQGPTIVSLAKKLGASALILGQHRWGLLGRMLGKKDTPGYCIKNSDCLVLAVEHKTRRAGFTGYSKTASQVRILRYL